ncbi:MAG TPA: Ig-like domain-containing protein [Frankiaceae bacterium]|jgi:VCBS repeat-containing protein|nr:Ig-like domain-containing protein [Frankiaceae bacterium]
MSGRLFRGATPSDKRTRLHARVLLVLAGAVGLGGVFGMVAHGATPPAYAASASVAPALYYIGDSAGSNYVFTVKNTGTSVGIGAVEIARPNTNWTVIGCTAPAGWSAQQSSTMCRFRSSASKYGIAPKTGTKSFTVKARTAAGNVDRAGTWPVVVSRTNQFDNPSLLKYATPSGGGLTTKAHTFELTTAVVSDTAKTPGSVCPAANKTAVVGSAKTIVVCGRNRANIALLPSSANSSLSGTFVKTKGTFSTGLIPARSGNVVLAQWVNTTVSDVFGSGKKVVAQVGSRSDRTSPLRTFTGYFASSSPPVANADAYTTDEDTTLNVSAPGVLANDTDAEGDPLTAVEFTSPSHGTLTPNADGSFTYVPSLNYHGTDSFAYKAFDTHTKSGSATVTITVNAVNDAPVAQPNAQNVGEDSTGASIDVLGNDSDVDGDTLAVSAVDTTGTIGTVTNNGTDVTYEPGANFQYLGDNQTATTSFTYTVSDGAGGLDVETVTLTIVGDNDDPVAADDSYTTDEDSGIGPLSVLINDTDAEAGVTLTGLTQPTNGGSVSDNHDGTVSFAPGDDFQDLTTGGPTRATTFTYTVTDAQNATDTATVTVTVSGINDAPDAVADSPTVPEDSDGQVIDVLANDTDAEGQTLTITGIDTTGTTGTVTNNGTDVTYDPNGQFEALGGAPATGPDSFTYTISDGNGGTDTVTVSVTIAGDNDAPDAVNDAYSTDEATQIGPLSILSNDSDAEGAVTVTTVSAASNGGTVTDNHDGTVSFDPAGAFEGLGAGQSDTTSFTYTVKDGEDVTDTATVTITVNGINDAPVAQPNAQNVGEDSTGDTVLVLGNDTDAESQTLTVTGVDTTGTTGTVTNNGTDVTYSPNGQFEALGNGQTATDTFTYTVTDSQGGTDTATVTITVVGSNDSPTAADDAYATDEATQIGPLSVLGNDTDDESAVTIKSIGALSNGGTVTNNGDGTVTFSPAGAFEDLANGEHATTAFTYTVEDAQGATSTATVTITVNGINDAPLAGDDAKNVGEDSSGATVTVLGNDTDAEGQTLTVTGVDTTGTTGTVTNNGTDVTYDPNGQFEHLGDSQSATDTFTYTVTDSQGGTDTATVTITVVGDNDDPVALDDAVATNENTATAPLNVLINDSDAEGALTVTGVSATSNGGTVTNNSDGTVTFSPAGAFEALANGEHATTTFTYTVKDAQNATDTATVTVTVNGVNDAPAGNDDAKTVGEDSTGAVVSVLGNDSDAESQTLTVSAVDTSGTNGTVTNNGTDVTYDPNGMYEQLAAGETATDTFTYTVTDTQGGTDTATVTITVSGANDAPVAVDDAYNALQDTELAVTAPGVLGNDTDADTSNTRTAGNASEPAHGSVTLDAEGSFSYVPDSGYTGPDSFTYDVTDGTATDTGTVSITVIPPNATPTADATSASGNEDGGPITVTLTGHDDDGDALTFDALTALNGLVTVPSATSCDANVPSTCTATVTYTPNADVNGVDTFTYTVNDNTLDSAPATATVTVNPVNDVPSFTKGGDQTVNEDAGAQTVTGWATAISAGPANESAQTVSFVVTNNANNLFATQPTVASDGTLEYLPKSDANGVATVSVKATDDGGTANGGVDTSPVQTFTITVNAVNDAPSFTKGADQTVMEDGGVNSVSNWATAISKGPADESAQTVSFTTTNDNNALFTTQPGVSPTGTLVYTPAANAVGSATVTVSLSDNGGTANGGDDTSDGQTFTITVSPVNDAPSFTTAGNQTVLEDAGANTVNGFVTSTSAGPADESAQTVTVAVTNVTNPTLFSVAPSLTNGTLTYTPAANANGASTVTVQATDDGGTANGGVATSPTQTFTITVTAVNDVPSFTKGADQTLNEDAGIQSVSNWATAISRGPADESAQTVSFTVTNNNNGLFVTQPAVSPTGTLTFTSAPNKYGTATVSVAIVDNGGTANGGDDTSDAQTFTITVNPVNDAPVAAAKAYTVQANMKISLSGLLTGATDPNDVAGDATWSPTFTVGSITPGASCVGCTISNVDNALGTFDFDPPAGGSGTYSVTYTVVDNGFPAPGATSAPQTITFTVNGPVVWFVDTTVAAGGTGRLSAPFNTLAPATTAMGSNANNRIFVRGGNVTGNVTLPTDGWLISEAATGASFDAVMGITPPAGTIARPAVNGTQRTVTGTVTLGTNSTVRGVDISQSGGNKGLVASGKTGLTVNQMSISTGAGRAVDLSSSSGVFSIKRVDTSGADRGISLLNTNVSTGSFTITGSGTAGSGGTITGSTGTAIGEAGIYLNNTKSVSLSRMNVTSGSGNGIYANTVNDFALDNSTISNNGTNEVNDHDGINGSNVTGTVTLDSITVFGSREDNAKILNNTGTATITVSNSTFRDNNASVGANGLYIDSSGTAAITFTSTSNTFQRNHTSGLAIFAQSSQRMNTTVTNGSYVTDNGVGLDIETNGSGGMQFSVSGGTVTGCASCAAPVVIYKGTGATGTGTLGTNGTLSGMTVTNGGSLNAPGIWVHGEGPGSSRLAITNNTVSQVGHYGILVSFGNNGAAPNLGAQNVDVSLTGNNVNHTGVTGSLEGIFVDSGLLSADTTVTCAHISGNTITQPADDDVRVRNRQAGTSLRLPGYAGSATDHTAVANFLKAQNTISDAFSGANASSNGIGGGAACAAP